MHKINVCVDAVVSVRIRRNLVLKNYYFIDMLVHNTFRHNNLKKTKFVHCKMRKNNITKRIGA